MCTRPSERTKRIQAARIEAGTTLLELVIATAIFGFLTLILLSIINFGTRSWRNVESRYAVETEIRRAVFDMNREMRATNISTATAGTSDIGGGAYVPWICFASAAKNSDETADIDVDTTAVSPLYFRWILYYCLRSGDHTGSGTCSPDVPSSSQYFCPHKLLIKKELYWEEDLPDHKGYELSFLTSTIVKNHLTPTDSLASVSTLEGAYASYVKSSYILARNVLVFATNYCDPSTARGDLSLGAPELQFTLRCFKVLESGISVKDNAQDLYGFPPTLSVQINSKVVPYINESSAGSN
ncbi:MAG: hypothetical protein RDV48_07920 [Candidatus Eremiobacteraeota bacterium]|nr:hypothetical protein [Candidatus Eremiobacteraeota bacterium]